MLTEPDILIQRLIAIVESRINTLERKKTITDTDCRIINEFLKILITIKRNDENVEAEMQKLLARIPTDKLKEML